MSQLRVRAKEPDEACAQATDLARSAAEEVAGAGRVGEHIGIEADGDRVVTHLFCCLDPAYQGWHWAVTVARASWAKTVTVDESLLLPGPEAILAPAWVPWRERLLPGDLGVGDILPAPPDDDRLVPVAAFEGDDGVTGWSEDTRARVLSPIGRDTTSARWYSGDHGPASALAHAAPGACVGCGFFVRLAGPLGQAFGVCANAYAPDDGRVVSVDHGCGAHSEALFAPADEHPARPVIDELGYDMVDMPGISVDETVFEPLDHG